MRRNLTCRAIATVALPACLLFAIAGPSWARPASAPVDPCYNTDPLYAQQEIQLDVLPIAVIYHPPGKGRDMGDDERDVRQDLELTQRFGTRMTVTEIKTNEETISLGMSVGHNTYTFLSASAEQTEETSVTVEQETGSAEMRISTSGWRSGLGDFSGGPDLFPGEGDKIVFLLRPRFTVTYVVGHIHTDFDCDPDHEVVHVEGEPRFHGMVLSHPGELRRATVWEIRGRTDNARFIEPSDTEALLRSDPFASGGSDDDLFSVRRRRIQGDAADPNLPRRRFGDDPVTSAVQWKSCDSYSEVRAGEENVHTSSLTTTYVHNSSVTATGEPTIPVGPLQVSPSVSYGSTVKFEYSHNLMTESAETTDASAIFASDGAECNPDGPMLLTEVWYDSAFGTLAFPTSELGASNVMGQVQSGGGSSRAAHIVTVTGDGGTHVQTRTDSDGHFELFLEPGRYTLRVGTARGGVLGEAISFEAPDPGGGRLELDAIILGAERGARESPDPTATPTQVIPRTERDPAPVTPTSTPTVRGPGIDIRVPTATSTPDRSRPFVPPLP